MTAISRIFDFPYYQLDKHNSSTALNTKVGDKWIATSSKEYLDKANAISRALLRLNIKPNDKIALISTTNRTEWNIMDIGIMQIGAQTVPIYPTISSKEFEYIFNHAEVKLCFLSDKDLFEKAQEAAKTTPTLERIYAFDKIDGCENWSSLLDLGADTSNQDVVETLKNEVRPEDLASIIYTSGTTGVPKGVMISHQGLVSSILSAIEVLPSLKPNTKVLSFLPMCHILERSAIYTYQYFGCAVYYGEGIEQIGDNVREVGPEIFTVVPRLIEKVYDKIYTKGSTLTGLKRKLFFWAVELGQQFDVTQKQSWWYRFQLKMARKLIFKKWKEALGGNLKHLICGSAALQPRFIQIFGAAEIRIIEGYGLTEAPVVSANSYRQNKVKLGTVGQPISAVNISIAKDGEILVEGSNLMLGYYKDPERTNEVLKSGVFHTGDKGMIDSDGFLKITGRKKEIFKTSGGKYISPALIENQLKQSRFIDQVMVVGENEKMPGALIQLDFEFLQAWAEKKGHDLPDSLTAIVQNKKVIKRITKEVNKANKKFGQWEKIKAFELTDELWTIENGLLTPTMKMKRDAVLKKFKDLYKKIYS